MANKPLTMLQIRRILKLFMEECSIREFHRQTGIHRVTLKNYLHRFRASGKSFVELADLSDHDLAQMVHPSRNTKAPDERFEDQEGRLKGYAKKLASKRNKYLTKQVLWEEYLKECPNGYHYSQFCHYLEQHLQRNDLTMVVPYHEPGNRLQIDFAGEPLWIVTPRTSERIACPVIVCTLPCSSFFYAEPLASARQEHLIPALNRALVYLGGVPRNVLSDNMAQSVTGKAAFFQVSMNL
ncbi:Transposase [Prosthecochloris sp. CIB 2401]|nr:Transposase [Prosthecochloris sp. CIB 2401]